MTRIVTQCLYNVCTSKFKGEMMTYINKNMALNKLRELVEENFNYKANYLPQSFMTQQKEALELFQKRIFLEEVIEETIAFNKNLSWQCEDKQLQLTTTAESLVDVYQLRSEIYRSINYQDEFPDTIEGLNFDGYDKHSAIIYYKNGEELMGTIRVIFDTKNKLPSEEKYSFDTMRKKYNQIAEVSRLTVKHKSGGLNIAFRYLMKGLYLVFNHNDVDITLSGIKQEHFKLYSKLGGVDIVEKMDSYGSLDIPFIIMSWDLSKTSKFFNKVFLK